MLSYFINLESHLLIFFEPHAERFDPRSDREPLLDLPAFGRDVAEEELAVSDSLLSTIGRLVRGRMAECHHIERDRAATAIGGHFKTPSRLPKPSIRLLHEAFKFFRPAAELGISRRHCASCWRFCRWAGRRP